ncbi:PilX N-terminal domain-containing pilus assembly protein [uncultured Deefgea sp.]|uniref:PilX N-terminal domain-containing pilus assembly protein n=1 Tax=uncultured Deefgea sp. TaxID=1304914 RepID=UPI00259A775C|nr:PilX N-terminal domain-containing pilus assembly protein [uncultured Deefgea sp.]
MQIYHSQSLKNQSGIATLLVSIMILIILGLLTLYTNRSVIIEQRSATNEFKQAQALEAAQSGMAKFMGQLGGTDDTTNWKQFFTQSGSTITLKAGYSNSINTKGYLNTSDVYAHNFSPTTYAIAETLPQPKNDSGVVLTGINQTYKVFLASTGTTNRFKLISQGCADSCTYAEAFTMTEFSVGSVAICPFDINGNLNGSAGSSLHGLVNNDPRFTCGISVGSVSGDTNDTIGCESGSCNPGSSGNYNPPHQITGTKSKDDHFKKYFPGKTQAQVLADRTAGHTASPRTACLISGNAGAADLTACTAAGLNQIYITGNLSIGPAPLANLGHGMTTGPIKGVELIVAGDLNLSATLTMFGSLYVVGSTTTTTAGSLTAYGSAAFSGNVNNSGSFSVYVDSVYTKAPSGSSGVESNISLGSWRDF